MTTACMATARTLQAQFAWQREPILFLAAIEGWMRAGKPSSERVRVACVGMLGAIERDAHRVSYSLSGVTQAEAQAWLNRLHREVEALGVLGPAAVTWAAVDAWNDAGRAPWTRFAEAARRLAQALEPEDCGSICARAAVGIRGVMR